MACWSNYLALGALCLTLTASSFAAEPTAAERETARALLKEGDWLFASNKYPDALERYRAAHAIMGLPTTGMSVVRCLVATGHLVEARDLAIQIARSAPGKQEKPAFAAARTEASSTATSLEPRIPDLTITLAGVPPHASAVVTIDGSAIPAAAIGHPWKLDPGKHVVEASLAGRAPIRVERVLSEGEHASVDLPFAAEAQTPPRPAASASPPVGSASPSRAPASAGRVAPEAGRTDSLRGPESSSKVLPYALMGVGGASLAAGMALGWKALDRKSFRDDHCDASGCDQSGLDADREGRQWATWATIASGAGAAALGVGLYLVIARSGGSPPATATVSPLGRGASLTLRW